MGEAKRRKDNRDKWADLFENDSGVAALVCRPEKRTFLYRKNVQAIDSTITGKIPPALCFDFDCANEITTIDNTFVFVATSKDLTTQTPITTMAACPTCSKKSDDEILAIVRAIFADRFHIDMPSSKINAELMPVLLDNVVVKKVDDVLLGVVNGIEDSCEIADVFVALLEYDKLRRFKFAYARGHGNCFFITGQLYHDLKDIGLADRFAFKTGFSNFTNGVGEPIGRHAWIEYQGWAIDGSNGYFGHPLLFQRDKNYYESRQLSDIKDVVANADGGLLFDGE